MTNPPIIAGNWKMNPSTIDAAITLITEIKNGLSVQNCDIIVSPPYPFLPAVAEMLKETPIKLAAQNIHEKNNGAYTGEISGTMLTSIGATHAIIAHSERRQYFGESNDQITQKLNAATQNNVVPIFCIGETLEERDSDNTFNVLAHQLIALENALPNPDLILAYEPVWAIGTGKTATPDQAEEVHAFIHSKFPTTPILYGGSVKPENAKSLILKPNIDGFLVGGASLKADAFLEIILNAGA